MPRARHGKPSAFLGATGGLGTRGPGDPRIRPALGPLEESLAEWELDLTTEQFPHRLFYW